MGVFLCPDTVHYRITLMIYSSRKIMTGCRKLYWQVFRSNYLEIVFVFHETIWQPFVNVIWVRGDVRLEH